MLKKIQIHFFIAVLSFAVFACGEESNPRLESETFTSIFDSNQFDDGFSAIDIKQTSDGGYIVLAEKDLTDTQLTGTYLIKADKIGNFVKFISADTLLNPVGKLNYSGGKYYFFARKQSSQAVMASVDANLDGLTSTDISTTFPAASATIPNSDKLLLLSYNNDGKQSIISEVGFDGNIGRSKNYTIGVGDKSEEPIMRHYLKTGKQFPFDVGVAAPGLYYYNGFFDYTFSLIFTDMSNKEAPIGRINGQQYNGGFSAVAPISGTTWAAARFNFGDNYLIPKATITSIGSSNASDMQGFTLPELIDETKVKILRDTINNKPVLIYAGDTQTRQIGLYFYDEAAGTFMSSRYLGFSNPFQVGGIVSTSDGGLAVVGNTYLAGRFARLCIFKLSKEEVASNVK